MGGEAKLLAEVRLEADCDLPLVSAKCLGQMRYFILGSGSNVTFLDKSLRPKLGDPIRSSKGREIFKSPPVNLGGLQLTGRAAVCTDLSQFSDYVGLQLTGILGLDSLDNHIVELDLSGLALRVYDCVPNGTKRDSKVVRLYGDRTGMRVRAKLPAIGPQEFLLDSGNAGSLQLNTDLFERLVKSGGIDQRYKSGALTESGEQSSETGRLRRLTLGDFKHEGLSIMKSPSPSSIGCAYLRRYVAVFDFPNHRLYLKPSKHFNDSENVLDKSGLLLFRHNGQTVVDLCGENSPGEVAGLQEKDRILSVNNKPVEKFSLYELRKLLMRDGEEVKMSIQRGEKPFDVIFRLREFRTFLPQPAEETSAKK